MAINPSDPNGMFPFSFSDFPEDIQLCILSFLTPLELSIFSCTSKSFESLCRNDSKLWFSMCERRWGSKTQIRKWGKGKITYKQLYNILDEYENLIGFWRCSGQTKNSSFNSSPPLVFFDWGPFFITGSRVSPSRNGSYDVMKESFLLMSITRNGDPISFLDPDCKLELSERVLNLGRFGALKNELVPVSVSFMGKCHVVVEQDSSSRNWSSPEGKRNGVWRVWNSGNMWGEECGGAEDVCGSPGSSPDGCISEIYQYFANKMSPGGNGSSRRQRRREKESKRKRKWDPEHLVKIVNCSPTPSRPLQGLWKGICDDDLNLDFYLVVYDDVGGIVCRRVGDSSKLVYGFAPVFWTSNVKFIDSPFCREEENMYDGRVHLRPPTVTNHNRVHPPCSDHDVVSRILYVSSSSDLVVSDLAGNAANSQQVEGRVWQYSNGTFGFGFRCDNYIVDLKHIAQDGNLLDTNENCNG